jgi:phosphohistidine phosphatase SixA
MTLQRIIIARHGAYIGSNGELVLSNEGKRQATRLAEKLKGVATGKTVVITSSARRAVETAEIIARALSVPYMPTEALWTDALHDGVRNADLPPIIERFAEGATTAIIVAHFDHGFALADRLAEHFLDSYELHGKQESLGHAEACVLDLKTKIISALE